MKISTNHKKTKRRARQIKKQIEKLKKKNRSSVELRVGNSGRWGRSYTTKMTQIDEKTNKIERKVRANKQQKNQISKEHNKQKIKYSKMKNK